MKTNRILLWLAIFTVVFVANQARADQGPPFEIGVAFRHATAIVDATVKDFTASGAAKIEIHKKLKGPKGTPTLIVGSPTDTAEVSPASKELEKGARYILLLNGDKLANYGFRKLHAFKIRAKPDGKLECQLKHFLPAPTGTLTYVVDWLPLAELEERVAKALAGR